LRARYPQGLRAEARYEGAHPTFPNGCHIAEVEIDPETGQVAVVSYHAVDDFGRLMNPMLVAGQVHGGVVQGLGQALLETRRLAALPAPDFPCLTVLGVSERIVHIDAIKARMANWPGSSFDLVPDAEHELMMEKPAIRKRFYDGAAALFDRNR